MLIDIGTHKIKKYAHTLVIDSTQEQKQANSSRILTSTSSKKSKQKETKRNLVQLMKRTRNHSFSPQLSLQRYRMKQKFLNIPNIRKSQNNEVKLLISSMKQKQTQQRRYTPIRQTHKEVPLCSHCLSHSNNKTCRYYKLPFQQQKKKDFKIQGRGQFQLTEYSMVDNSNKIIFLTHRPSARRTLKPAKKDLKTNELKPWDLSQSLSDLII